MRLSYLPTNLRATAVEMAERREIDDDLSTDRILELLLNSEGIYGYGTTILGFVRAIDAAEAHERNSTTSGV